MLREIFVKLMIKYKIKGMENLYYREKVTKLEISYYVIMWCNIFLKKMWCNKLIVYLIIYFFAEIFNHNFYFYIGLELA